MVNVTAATLLFALWHSFLCSDWAKNRARQLLGARRGTALYRGFFMIQSVPAMAALIAVILRQPHRVLYQARGARRFWGWGLQAGSLLVFALAMFEFDKPKFLGIKGALDLKKGDPITEAQAQGPELEPDGTVRARGVFRYSRHPLEWALTLLFLATPTLKTNWLVFDVLNAFYSFVGALHEEKRLERASPDYPEYQKQTPFFFGLPRK